MLVRDVAAAPMPGGVSGDVATLRSMSANMPGGFPEDLSKGARRGIEELLQRYFANAGDPVPSSFSRHATIHSVSDEQYRDENSLASLLLVVALTKEADLLMDEGDQQKRDGGNGGK
jgi:hypothetical protein